MIMEDFARKDVAGELAHGTKDWEVIVPFTSEERVPINESPQPIGGRIFSDVQFRGWCNW